MGGGRGGRGGGGDQGAPATHASFEVGGRGGGGGHGSGGDGAPRAGSRTEGCAEQVLACEVVLFRWLQQRARWLDGALPLGFGRVHWSCGLFSDAACFKSHVGCFRVCLRPTSHVLAGPLFFAASCVVCLNFCSTCPL